MIAYLDLCGSPFIDPAEQTKRETTKPLQDVSLPNSPYSLEPFIFGPAVCWNFEDALVHIHEANSLIYFLESGCHDDGAITSFAGNREFAGPPHQSSIRIQSAVVACNDAVVFLRLEPATGFERIKGLLCDLLLKGRPAAGDSACMYVIELFGIVPRIGSADSIAVRRRSARQEGRQVAQRMYDFSSCVAGYSRIFDVEVDIGGHLFRLNRRQIRGNDLCAGEQIAHLNSPVAHARGNVEDVSRRSRLGERCKEEPVVEDQAQCLSLQRQSLLLYNVVGEGVS